MSQHTHLLLIGLGPVQDFIRTARRSRDYWYGSRLLSELAKIAARTIRAGGGGLIFPPPALLDDPDGGEGERAVANKVLATVAGVEHAGEIASEAREAVAEHIGALWATIEGRLAASHEAAMLDAERGRAQLAEMIELQWVSVPIGADYFGARATAEAMLSERKATRDWTQPTWGDGFGVPKSSLDGAREQVFHEAARESLSKHEPWRLRRLFDVQPHESLCGPGLLKRLGDAPTGEDEPERFHSTSHMAAAPLLSRLARVDGHEALVAYRAALKDEVGIHPDRFRVRTAAGRPALVPFGGGGEISPPRVFHLKGDEGAVGYDGSLFFEGRLAAALEENPTAAVREELEGITHRGARRRRLSARADAARAALARCLRSLGVAGVPCPYYAFLLADGDHMGRVFDRRPSSKSVADDIEWHRKLAAELAEFAARAREIVLRYGGSPIYAGGDDVSAMLPLHTAIPCARALRDAFIEVMASACPDLAPAELPTLSAGVAIVHHLTDMSDARSLAEDAERAAKDPARGGRDALAIIADKRSGATLEIYGKWSEAWNDTSGGSPDGLDGRLWRWCALYRAGRLSHGAAFELEALLRPFEQAPDPASARAVRRLAERAIGRRRVLGDGGADPLDLDVRALLSERIGDDPVRDVRLLSAELQVARLMLGALRDAWGAGDGEEAA